ncbi:MAG: glycosyltransferase family 4 protein [Candidatus Bathyarchaeota archaeon]|nr:glycosyltransferase family 4 protein [Candidatus Bathyarchaeota archaeon]
MKVSLILGFPNPFAGAAWTRIHFFANDWSGQGHKIDVLGTFTPSTLKQAGSNSSSPNIGIYNLAFYISSHSPFIFALNCVSSFFSSFFFLGIKKPDVVVISVPPGDVGIGALAACKLLRIKNVMDYRDEWENFSINNSNGINKFFYSMVKKTAFSMYLKSNLMVVVTKIYYEQMRGNGISKVKILPNGADIKTFKPLPTFASSDKKLNLIYSGGIGSYYRLDVVLKSVKRLINGCYDVQLFIAGQGDTNKVIELAKELSISNKIIYLGVISEKQKLNDLISSADVGIIPYDDNPLWKNSLPAKFFEYCACGKPVVATAYPDSLLARIIRDNEIGFVVDPLNDEELANVLSKFVADVSLRKTAGHNAEIFVKNNFDRKKISELYLNNLKDIYLTSAH